MITGDESSQSNVVVHFYSEDWAAPMQSIELTQSSLWRVAPDTRADRVWLALDHGCVIALYDLATGQELRRFDLLGEIPQQGIEVLAAPSGFATATVWSAMTGNPIAARFTEDSSVVLAATLIGDGATAVLVMAPIVGCCLGSVAVTVWDVATASMLRAMPLPDRPDGMANYATFANIAAAPNGRRVAIGTVTINGTGGLDVFDIEAGVHLRHFLGGWTFEGPRGVHGVTYGRDGLSLSARYHDFVREWDVRDLVTRPRCLRSPHGNEIHWDLGALQFAPSLNGPWADLPAASPFRLSPNGDHGCFRVKVEE